MNFERKEARLRADQYAELTAHARRLNNTKGTSGERITENTLIRIAINLTCHAWITPPDATRANSESPYVLPFADSKDCPQVVHAGLVTTDEGEREADAFVATS